MATRPEILNMNMQAHGFEDRTPPPLSQTSSRTISVEEMTSGEGLKFGLGYLNPTKLSEWNPDDWKTKNPHALITGTSGAGKSTLLRQVIKYLANKNKYVFVVDLHGDLNVPGVQENYIEITARNSQYGINPFDFEKDPKNGGVRVQSDSIVQLFKKTFMPNLGSLQEKVFKKLIIDTYHSVGITDEDVDTWNKELPTMKELNNLLKSISQRVSTGLHYDFITKFERCSQKIIQSENKREILEKYEIIVDEEISIPNLESSLESVSGQIDKDINKLDEMWKEFRNSKLFAQPLSDIFGDDLAVDLDFYARKDVIRVLDTLSIYISTLYESGIFHSELPPIAGNGNLHRIDISGLSFSLQSFFTDILLSRIFRAKKLRGEYDNCSDKSRGARVDTYVIIDESKLVLPQGKEKENPYQSINRIASESRKYGLGLILASQKPSHFPNELLTNIDLKIVLTTAEIDKKPAMKLLGIKDPFIFSQTDKFGVAAISQGAQEFESIALPWVAK